MSTFQAVFLIIPIFQTSTMQKSPSKHLENCSSLPLIDRNLLKSKKYYYKPYQKGPPLQQDLDNMMHSLVLAPSTPHKMSYKLKRSIDKTLKMHSVLSESIGSVIGGAGGNLNEEMGRVGEEMRRWVARMPPNQRVLGEEYKQFTRLTEESRDYLEFYLRTRMKMRDDLDILKTSEPKIILSVLRNNYACLTENPPEVANRILLSLKINPLNDFHLVDWNTFSLFHKMARGVISKHQGRHFLTEYLMAGKGLNETVPRYQVWNMVGKIMGKLMKVGSQSALQSLIVKVKQCGERLMDEDVNRATLSKAMLSGRQFIWEHLLTLLFR